MAIDQSPHQYKDENSQWYIQQSATSLEWIVTVRFKVPVYLTLDPENSFYSIMIQQLFKALKTLKEAIYGPEDTRT